MRRDPALERALDELYGVPLSEFTATRNRLAKSLNGKAAKELKTAKKPPLSAWLVNRVYRDDRKTFDALLAAGKKLRSAQAEGPAALVKAKQEQAVLLDEITTAAHHALKA